MNDLQKVFSSPSDRNRVERLIEKSPAPYLARTNLLRLIESGGLRSLRKLPRPFFRALFQLLGSSAYLSDILIRSGPNWPDFFQQQIQVPQKTVLEHLAEFNSLPSKPGSLEQLATALRQHKQREFLRIGARDLCSSVGVEETMRELTALAEAGLEIAYRFCRSEVEKDFGRLLLPDTGKENRFVVLGMGKLGGEELNFSSDIDIIYLYEEDEGESGCGRKGKASPREFFTGLAGKITRVMSGITEEGFVFRTDLRLRPLGRNGPLVQSLGSSLVYYESWGQCWERSALIKARPVAASRELGGEFLKAIEPFVYRRYLDFTTVEELRHMKLRIEQELLSPHLEERNLKLGRGGIREIEFFAQALQLVNGGYETRIRTHKTLRALDLLARYGYIPSREKNSLAKSYRFLREVEHKIQMVQEAHAHSIPDGDEEERTLARRLGFSRSKGKNERDLFWKEYRRHTDSVRRAFDRLFYGAQKENLSQGTSGLGEIWKDLDQEELILKDLDNLAFPEPQKAYQNLLAIRDGATYTPPSPRRLQVMRTLGPPLITEVARSVSPDRALFNFAEFSHRVGARTGFLSLLAENPKTMRLLVRLFAGSQFLTEIFLKRPELLDSLIRVDLTEPRKTKKKMLGELMATFGETGDLEEKLNDVRRYKAEEFIRIGLHDLGGTLEFQEVICQLSDLADTCLRGALILAGGEIERSFGKVPQGRFAILGMGKLGGREIDYNSDLDLIFIYDAPEGARSDGGQSGCMDAHEYYVKLGQKLITFVSAPTAEGIAYKIDMRLRPSGRAGPLVSSIESFRAYHQSSSELWERQALIKARGVAGDQSLGHHAEKVAESFAYGRRLTQEGVTQINHLRMRMEKELAQEDQSQFNLKKGKGGMVDIEFLVQMLQLSYGCQHPGLRKKGTLEALTALQQHRIIKKNDYQLLSEGYLFLRRLDHRLRLERDQSIDVVEREPEKLNGIAQALGYKGSSNKSKKTKRDAGERLLLDYELRRGHIRTCYKRFFLSADTEL
ncbi:MAG: bifunctional [glutamate--ammonia ligase]-adenylyl-L-tyrosine phosphorylase/[glutamate--ammonia-ligase] adenylyltransferase [Candidatus Binatia bacterium]